jgi:hypothetical protein
VFGYPEPITRFSGLMPPKTRFKSNRSFVYEPGRSAIRSSYFCCIWSQTARFSGKVALICLFRIPDVKGEDILLKFKDY